jgi:AraC-like DNA-binding protein/effector-binding domain-containing protein
MNPVDALLPLLKDIVGRIHCDHSLQSLAARAGMSVSQLQRAFSRMMGETPRQYVQRLRLNLAATRIAAERGSILAIALKTGYISHETFTRAFVRHFGCTPICHRHRALKGLPLQVRSRHALLSRSIGPCIRLFHLQPAPSSRSASMPTLSITRREFEPQPILFIRRKVARPELQGALAECFGTLFGHGHKAGLAIAGWPLARYVSMSPGLVTVDIAMPLATAAQGEGEMQSGELSGGPVAVGVHAGPYEQLSETHAAIERWIEARGLSASGPPWEWYVTDPAHHPDPADWRTEVYWPLAG